MDRVARSRARKVIVLVTTVGVAGCQAILGIDPDARHDAPADASFGADVGEDTASDHAAADARSDAAPVQCAGDPDCASLVDIECERGTCDAGACVVEPRDGLSCGAGGTCRGYACIGADTKIAAADDSTCIVDSSGLVWCWGGDEHGQLGDGKNGARSTPYLVPRIGADLPIAAQVFLGPDHACVILHDGRVACWGANGAGQASGILDAGAGPLAPNLIPSAPPSSSLAVGDGFTCALGTGTDVWCWGDNSEGEIGSGSTTQQVIPRPRRIDLFTGVTQISAASRTICAITNATIYCWGDNAWGQLGENFSDPYAAHPIAVPPSPDVHPTASFVATGWGNGCAIYENNVLCWGNDRAGQLGDGKPVTIYGDGGDGDTPHPSMSKVLDADAGAPLDMIESLTFGSGTHVCAYSAKISGFECWGQNVAGELGVGDAGYYDEAVPAPILGNTDRSSLALGDAHACALQNVTNGYEVACWGRANAGETGDGLPLSDHVTAAPTPVAFPKTPGGVAHLRATQ